MTIKFILTMSRPDTTQDFWWNLPSNDQYTELFESIHTVLEINVDNVVSGDGLTMTRTILANSEETWISYMETVLSVGDLIQERNEYCKLHNHRLTLTKIDAEQNSTVISLVGNCDEGNIIQ